ncbi:GNAT family N-acetyltransferase [Maritalea sp.]|uniref:GNAT family N-acetyltransferase n=1 Tax=Maritalea sp. TaxID=2003361 RepID=UPI003EF28770
MFMFDLKPQEFVPVHRRPRRWFEQIFPTNTRQIIGSSVAAIGRSKSAHREQKDPASLARIGSLEVRIAQTASEVRRAQHLRFSVFYEEMSAKADLRTLRTKRDADEFDPICDHIIVVDHEEVEGISARPKIVGTYRTLRAEVAYANNGFYSAAEFELKSMLANNWEKGFCEIGRSCVSPGYRDRRTIEALWTGLWAYSVLYDIDVFFGVASFEGVDVQEHIKPLSYLHHSAQTPEKWHVRARPDVGEQVNYLDEQAYDKKQMIRELPPLIKGYLRVGSYVGEGVFVDRQFGTTDVMIVALIDQMPERYKQHFRAATNLDRKN